MGLEEIKELFTTQQQNENGEPMVEIRGVELSFHEGLETLKPAPVLEDVSVPAMQSRKPDREDLDLLAKICALELEEEEESKRQASTLEVLDSDSEKGEESADPEREEPKEVQLTGSFPVKGILKRPFVTNSLHAKEEISDSPVKRSISFSEIVQEPGIVEFYESEDDDKEESESEDDLETKMMGNQIAIAYHRKRQQLLSAELLKGPKTEDDMYREQAGRDEALSQSEKNPLKSIFKLRMGQR